MKRLNIYIGIVIIVFLGLVSALSYRLYINTRFEESDKIAEEESARVVDPLPDLDISDTSTSSGDDEEPVSSTPNTSETDDTTEPVEVTPPAPAPQPQRFSGNWMSYQDYISTGSATVTEVEDGFIIQFSDDYSFSGAPDPFLYLSADNSQTLNNALVIGKLQSDNGAQAYKVTKEEFQQYGTAIYLWCRAFDVYMGQVILN